MDQRAVLIVKNPDFFSFICRNSRIYSTLRLGEAGDAELESLTSQQTGKRHLSGRECQEGKHLIAQDGDLYDARTSRRRSMDLRRLEAPVAMTGATFLVSRFCFSAKFLRPMVIRCRRRVCGECVL